MKLRLVTASGVEPFEDDPPGPGFTWADSRGIDEAGSRYLAERLGLSRTMIAASSEPTVVPKVVIEDDRLLVTLHSLDHEAHLLQTAYVLTPDALVTVQSSFAEGIPDAVVEQNTSATVARLRRKGRGAERPADLLVELVGTLAEWLENMLRATADHAGKLDRRLREGDTGDPESFLQEAFSVRHQMLTIANRAAQTRETLASLDRAPDSLGLDEAGVPSLAGRFARLRVLCDGEKEFLQGVLDFYQSQVNTKMNIAMERLALIAAVALPITAIGGVLGMNTIVNEETQVPYTIGLLAFMGLLALMMLVWAKRKGWW